MAQHRAYVQATPAGPVTLQHVDTPTPTSGEVLVRVLATPLLSYTQPVLDGKMFPLVHPFTPGIAAIGRVSSCGPELSLKSGQLVYCMPTVTARDDTTGAARILQGFMAGMDPASRRLAETTWRNGSWSEAMLVPAENVVMLDESRLTKELGYSIPELVWINDLMVPYGGWYTSGLKAGETVIVAPATGHFGGGAVFTALALGAGAVLSQLEKSDALGRVKAVKLTGDIETDAINLRTATLGGAGADIYLDFSPAAAGSSTQPSACISALKKGGQAILMGGVMDNISLNYAQLMIGCITVKGNFMYPRDAVVKMVQMLESGVVNLKGLTTVEIGFEKLAEGIKVAKTRAGVGELVVLTVA